MHHTDLPQLLDRWRRHFSFEIYEYVIFYCLRHVFPGDMFGVNPADEVEGLLFIYCKFQADQKPGKYQKSRQFCFMNDRTSFVRIIYMYEILISGRSITLVT